MSSAEVWDDDEVRSIHEINAEMDRIEQRKEALGPAVDAGDRDALAEYVSLGEQWMELLDERSSRRRLKDPLPPPKPAPVTPTPTMPATPNPLAAQAAHLRAVAADAEMQVRNTALPADVRNRALEDRAVALNRANHLERQAPFHGKTNDQLAEALEAARIATEEAVEARDALTGKSRAEVRRSKAERDLNAAREQIAAIEAELGRRHQRSALEDYVRVRSRQRAERQLIEERRGEALRIADETARQFGNNHWRTYAARGKADEVSASKDEIVARAVALEAEMRRKSDRDLRQMLTKGFIVERTPTHEPFRQRR